MSEDFKQRVEGYWAHTPAVVIVKEIKRRTEIPKWEDCPKDHIYVGIQRGKHGDRVTVVKHKLEGVFGLNCKAEGLREEDMDSIGAKPSRNAMVCIQCGEFSTRMNIGCICQDCADLAKACGKS